MEFLIVLIFFIFMWRGLGLQHNTPYKESEREKKRKLKEREQQELSKIKKYYLHPTEDWIDKIRTEMFDENSFTVISINDKLYVVGHTMMIPCENIWEAKKRQYRYIIEHSRK